MTDASYPVVIVQLSEEDGGGFMAYVPDLKGCMGDGATQAEALLDVQKAIKEWKDEAARLKRAIPEPGSSIKRAKQAREKLVERISIQAKAIEKLDGDVTELRAVLQSISDRMLDEPAMWASGIPFIGRRNAVDDHVH